MLSTQRSGSGIGVFYSRQRSTIGLGVDAQSSTGATRLYQRAGMRVAEKYEMYEQVVNAE